MDFMKVFDLAVREIKREVNLKVLKVPEIEQKVLDATSDEPWGPHGSALLEIAQATKNYTECQMIMSVVWTRLANTGPDWRHVYKALSVIEYLMASGSEHAVDDIIEHGILLSSLSGFEHVDPNGKDVGINVRKKAETILGLLNDREKIKAVRDKAAATRNKYTGLSSSAMAYKSGSTSFNSSSSFRYSDRYEGSNGTREGELFKDSCRDRGQNSEETKCKLHGSKNMHDKPRKSYADLGNKSKKVVMRHSRDKGSSSFNASKPSTTQQSTPSPKISSTLYDDYDDFDPRGSSSRSSSEPQGSSTADDFDPRGSSVTGSAAASFNKVDLFGESLIAQEINLTSTAPTPQLDLFANATFVSSPSSEVTTAAPIQVSIDLFANQPSISPPSPPKVDLFAASKTQPATEAKSPQSEQTSTNDFEAFAQLPPSNSNGSEGFGAFTSHNGTVNSEPSQNSTNDNLSNQKETMPTEPKTPPPKKEIFRVKSKIWADALSRGLIDLNISSPKKTSLANVGIVGGLDDGSEEKEKGSPTMAAGSAFPSSKVLRGSASFSGHGQQRFGSFK